MKLKFCAIAAIAGSLFANVLYGQEKTGDQPKKKHQKSISISNRGIRVETLDSNSEVARKGSKVGVLNDSTTKHDEKRFSASFAMVDLGLNLLMDNTNYADPAVMSYLKVPANRRNKELFDLRRGKSVNVNIYPWMIKYRALKTHGQRIYVSSGIGLQLYNFRYDAPLTYTKNPSGIILDTIMFHKDKLALNYLNIPLMLTFKTRLYKDNWLVYGAGITEGLRIGSWNKQVSDERGKTKTRGSFGLADFNTCATAEFGLEGVFRVYASYQLTSLYENGIDQHPLCIGFKFSGI